MVAAWLLSICSLKAGCSAAQLELSKVGMAVTGEWKTAEAKWGRCCAYVFVTNVAKLPRHPELTNFSPVAKHYLHICTTFDVFDCFWECHPWEFRLYHLTNSLVYKLAVLKPGDHQKQCSCLTSLGPMLHILEPSWEWIHAATSTSKVSVDTSPISPRLFPKCPMHAEFMRWTWNVLLRVLKKNMPAVRLKLQIGSIHHIRWCYSVYMICIKWNSCLLCVLWIYFLVT